MTPHPNIVVEGLKQAGYLLADLLPAYPGKDEREVDDVLRDNALALSRPVMSYGLLGIHSCRSRHFNVTEHGFRGTIRDIPWPPSSETLNIFCFGGSTMLGTNISDGETIPAHLQRRFDAAGVAATIYNFGSGNYTSRHEALRLLELLDRGIAPDHAIFLDGFNECFYAYGNVELVRVLDYLYQSEKQRRRTSSIGRIVKDLRRALRGDAIPGLPTAGGYAPRVDDPALHAQLSEPGILAALAASDRAARPDEITEFHERISRPVWDRYLDSVAMIRAVTRRRGIRTLFVWQPVPFYRTSARQRVAERLHLIFRYGVLTQPIYNWLSQADHPHMADAPDFLDLSSLSTTVDDVLYVDTAHYTDRCCAAIADAIGRRMIDEMSPSTPTQNASRHAVATR